MNLKCKQSNGFQNYCNDDDGRCQVNDLLWLISNDSAKNEQRAINNHDQEDNEGVIVLVKKCARVLLKNRIRTAKYERPMTEMQSLAI